MPNRRQLLALTLGTLPALALPAMASDSHGSKRLDNGLTEITGFLDRAETRGDAHVLIINAGGEEWTVDFPAPPANANDQPIGLALHPGMVLTVQGHQAQDTAWRMRASRLIIDGTPYDL